MFLFLLLLFLLKTSCQYFLSINVSDGVWVRVHGGLAVWQKNVCVCVQAIGHYCIKIVFLRKNTALLVKGEIRVTNHYSLVFGLQAFVICQVMSCGPNKHVSLTHLRTRGSMDGGMHFIQCLHDVLVDEWRNGVGEYKPIRAIQGEKSGHSS